VSSVVTPQCVPRLRVSCEPRSQVLAGWVIVGREALLSVTASGHGCPVVVVWPGLWISGPFGRLGTCGWLWSHPGEEPPGPRPQAVDGDRKCERARLDEFLHRGAGTGGQHELLQLAEEHRSYGAGGDAADAAEQRRTAQGDRRHGREQVAVALERVWLGDDPGQQHAGGAVQQRRAQVG